jgi:hypothetical protein
MNASMRLKLTKSQVPLISIEPLIKEKINSASLLEQSFTLGKEERCRVLFFAESNPWQIIICRVLEIFHSADLLEID